MENGNWSGTSPAGPRTPGYDPPGLRGGWELYDIESDRSELHDMAVDHPERVKELSDAWNQWAERASVLPSPLGDIK